MSSDVKREDVADNRATIVNEDTLVKPIICEAQILTVLDEIKSRYPRTMWSWIEDEVMLIENEDGETRMEWAD